MSRALVVAMCGCALASACGGGVDPAAQEVAVGLSTAATVGRSVSLAATAIGTPSAPACVSVTQACTTYPCQGRATVTLGPACPLFIGGAATGTITVSGTWSSATSATLTTELVDVKASGQANAAAVAKVTTITTNRSGNTVTVRYTGANATARASYTGPAVAAADTWDLTIDTKGTADPADDDLTVSSTSVGAGVGSAKVVDLDDVAISSSCRLNPVSGSGQITEVRNFIPSITEIGFHAACDGKIDVNGTPQQVSFFP